MIAIAIAWFLLGLLLLGLGGDSIVKAVSGLAQRFGARPFTAGLLLLGVATSMPELVVNARALAVGQPELALGNAVGSSIANLGLTLAIAAIAAPLLLRARLQAVLWWSLLGAGVLLILFGLDGRLARWEGVVLLAGFVVMQAVLMRRGRSETADVQAAIARSALSRTSLPLNMLRVLVAVVALYWGARLVVGAAADFGVALGWTPLLVGLLPLAIGTALPEVATAIAAARRGHGDMVLGHVLGSSAVNLLLVIGAMAALQPLALPASFVRLELPALLAFALVLYPMLRGDLKISRGEGVILLVAFVGWFVLELLLVGAPAL
ncbi:sodium:calcium antiporter [Stenotrophomonas sp. TWI143]|jgi:cation:H+ antiporter|uniref:sodium:calcium antiporter n=1 Tax=Stenotrophomonas TaxID=40323 RepID=UPI0013DB8C04|nr:MULTISPECIES: sodium:calcium antiporter [Stenotrophomonas]MBH1593080.1 sodium:calcium antiporter [Stenotrophomonas maltophilia]MBH1835134.1 sodium:calcium antiporter [Stenotrophomonas maltophilia]MDH2021765.1 sodium:calcium antiporter [Stenotrophomonas sp. GD03680]HDS1218556.1 sodium:calcium antiporter [Stenotrophomonas maltophilia]HDS1233448.1 sodium:calcium antiporter [Stenotrophomonas maltophilia]